ncbi:CAP domain-containing protein [Actinoplanes sp. NPDC026623]|uniref:CAP domain-containing protein n=1 Tax=Actinoplanes sp. NPDC026623 TaxID=3155610 RepID=UPI0033F92D8C
MFGSVRRLALVVAAPAALLGIAAIPTYAETTVPAVAAARGEAAPATYPALGDEVFALTNEERIRNGCAPLTEDEELTVAAVRQSHYMAATGDFGHFGWHGSTLRSRSRAAGYHAVAGENVAHGFTGSRQVMAAWMASPPHRANILNCGVRAIGAGVQRAANGTYYWTQVFGWR